MGEFFRNLVNMSIAASWLILAVMGLRPVMKKAPKWTRCLLWAMVAVRLICPFSFESALSLVPSPETLPQKVMTGPSYRIDTGVQPVDTAVNGYLGDRYFEGVTVPAHNGSHVMNVLGAVWLLGLLILALYGLVSYGRLRRDVREAVPLRDRVWICDEINTPFILGILRPRIYLPSDLISAQPPHVLPYVLAHEQAHLKRHDHWWKPLGFTLLAMYWFNPLVWAAYILLCRDIELACDEKVIRDFGMEERKAYSDALLSCSLSRRRIMACPLAFGEVGVRERIRSVLKYRKPAFGIVIGAVLICVVMGGCFLTNPKSDTEETNAGTSETDADHTAASAGAEPVIDGEEDSPTALTPEMLPESGGSTDGDIAGLLDAIESSPLSSSNPADYIQSHQEEYDTLISYGDQTLHYIFGQFLAGGQTGLRGLIMQTALDELAPESRLSLQAENGQAYFEAWAQEAERQAEEIGMEELEKYYPAAWLYMESRTQIRSQVQSDMGSP